VNIAPGANPRAKHQKVPVTKEKSFIRSSPGPNVIKLFTSVIMNVRNMLEFLYFHPSLMYSGKDGAYPGDAPFRFSTLG
jgi:hypothetical protein